MTRKSFRLPLVLSFVLMLGACTTTTPQPRDFPDNAQYWQRASVSETIYMRGTKAQQMLNRDISRCVLELRELGRLGAVKNAIPMDYDGRLLEKSERALNDWDTPERDQFLFAEHQDYQDFESCMLDKGWERVANLPYKTIEKAQDSYYKTHVDFKDDYRAKPVPMTGLIKSSNDS